MKYLITVLWVLAWTYVIVKSFNYILKRKRLETLGVIYQTLKARRKNKKVKFHDFAF